MFEGLFGKSAKPEQEQQEDEHNEALLPSSLTDAPRLRKRRYDVRERGLRIAVRTTLLCTGVYLGIIIWIGLVLKGTKFVGDPDKFCLDHISHYCR